MEQHGAATGVGGRGFAPTRGTFKPPVGTIKGALYRYPPDWTEITTEMKYDDVVYFASQLPRLRRQGIQTWKRQK